MKKSLVQPTQVSQVNFDDLQRCSDTQVEAGIARILLCACAHKGRSALGERPRDSRQFEEGYTVAFSNGRVLCKLSCVIAGPTHQSLATGQTATQHERRSDRMSKLSVSLMETG